MRLVELTGLAVVVAGWAATHLLSEARERRKEARGQIEKFIDRLQNLENTARSFHTAASFQHTQQINLITELDRLERSLKRIDILDQDALIQPIIFLRQAITLENFEPSTYVRQLQTSQLLQDIATASQDMEDEVERQYRRRYPPRFPYFQWPWQN